MSWNKLGERQYIYGNAYVVRDDQQASLVTTPIHPKMVTGGRERRASALRGVKLPLGRKALALNVYETTHDTFSYPNGEPANFSGNTVLRGLLSVSCGRATGNNIFIRAEILLARPDLITERAVECLTALREHSEASGDIYSLALAQLVHNGVEFPAPPTTPSE